MFFNYIKIAFRNMVKQKLFSLINITGLAVGLAVCIMMIMYVVHENSYDLFHKNSDRIFTSQMDVKFGTSYVNTNRFTYAAGAIIKQSQPSVEKYTRTITRSAIVSMASSPGQKFANEDILFADENFFDFFSFKLAAGQAANVLDKPFMVVISKDMAQKYFGAENPIGKALVLKTDSAHTYQVSGVAENTPSNSSIKFNFVTSNSSLLAMKDAANFTGPNQIGMGSFNVYLLLNHASDSSLLRKNLELIGKTGKLASNAHYSFSPLRNSHLENNYGDMANIKYLKIFPFVAMLILLLALVNYMSLSTARASVRAKEVGVRKVAGASRSLIAMQFYVESGLFTTLSFSLGYALAFVLKPWFLNTLQLQIDNSFLYSPALLTALVLLLIITVLLAGSYPSLVLSAFKPIITLKGKLEKKSGGTIVRKVFTTLQFTISIALIICGIVIDRQVYFFRHTDTGIKRDNIITIPVNSGIGKNYQAFKHDIQAIAGISSVATSHNYIFWGYDMFLVKGKTNDDNIPVASLIVDKEYIGMLGLKWKYPPAANTEPVAGKNILINETAVEKLHLPANPIGRFIQAGEQKLEIAGVLKDYHFASMEKEIMPMSLKIAADTGNYFANMGCNLFVKIKPHTNLPTLLAKLQGIYGKYNKDAVFDYAFLDDVFNKQYKAEDSLASVFSFFIYVTMALATLGLFGLAAFTIEQRAKEIGIRKVLGASLASINTLLSRDFLMLVVLSIVIASPVAWWAMHRWLEGFAYRIAISWWVFAVAGLAAIITAIVTVSYHAIKAGIANPVDSLRSE